MKRVYFVLAVVLFVIGPSGFAGSITGWGDANYDEVLNNIPSGNDFVSVTSWANNALAFKSDGTYVTWGDNYQSVLDVPAGIVFTDININYGYGLGVTPEPTTILLLGLGGLVLRRRRKA